MIPLSTFFSNKPILELLPGHVLFCVSWQRQDQILVQKLVPLLHPSQTLYNAFMPLTGLRNNHERRVEAATATELGKRFCREQSSLVA